MQFGDSNQVCDWNQSTSQSASATSIELSRLQPSTSSSFGYPTSENYQNTNLNSKSIHTNFREKTTREDNDSLLQGINTWTFGHLKSSTNASNFHRNNENSEIITSSASYVPEIAQQQTGTERNLHRIKHPENKDPRYEVDFFKGQHSSASGPGINPRPGPGQAIDLTRFAHLIKPPFEIDGIESSGQPIPVTVNNEKSDWHQGLFECRKTGWKMMLAFALCPDITAFLKIDRQAYREDPIENLLFLFYSIQHKLILPGLLCLIILVFLYKTQLILWLILFSSLLPVTFPCYWAAHCGRRCNFEDSYNIKSYHCCIECLITCAYCESCSLCQLYSELEYQKNLRGPENVIIHRT